MKLNNEAVEEFRKIWKEEYGQDLSKPEAYEYSENLMGFFKVLMDIDKK